MNSKGKDQEEYIRQVMVEFIKATAVEDNENLISSYLGLSLCQFLLGDYTNAQISFDKISKIELRRSEKVKSTVAFYAVICVGSCVGGQLDTTAKMAEKLLKREKIEEYKQKIMELRFPSKKNTNEVLEL